MSLFQRIAKTLRIGNAKYIKGHDLNGNAYLELPSLSGSLDPRHTRRSIQWKEKKELGDYDQRSIPVQWVMWLRHTRREPPCIDELVRDRQRILVTQANAAKLALEDQQKREREQQARLQHFDDVKQGGVPTSNLVDQQVQQQANTRVTHEQYDDDGVLHQQRTPDQHVWAASRARLAAKAQLNLDSQQAPSSSSSVTSPHAENQQEISESLQQAMQTRAARRAASNQQDAERERARREMTKSPLDAFVPMPKPRK
ncbi:related to Mimitin, mitochondrial precursor [Melanopsichium pennsylvanicum]|uniref:Related to Mimitin, mitochondrial n=2 Tax=Melanopsichium pennsylvanicum TaxID=63383 RepID=A0AAJ4XRJ1_9BASI|nr:related to Mimitin, mitochondrial precursor [Melanopsichium pennsylvanicum 4]SNX87169.1 related to Mimitin, mitochondrial precursor [Melanopsichium pennsylvanicum]